MGQTVKNLPVMQESQVLSLGGEDPLEKEMATHFTCPQSFPASGSFLISQPFALGIQSIGASASVLPMNIQS